MNNLKRLRTEKGLTQAQLAESAGTSQRMIQKYESGERDIQKAQVQTVHKMAQTLECTMEDIVKEWEDSMCKRLRANTIAMLEEAKQLREERQEKRKQNKGRE